MALLKHLPIGLSLVFSSLVACVLAAEVVDDESEGLRIEAAPESGRVLHEDDINSNFTDVDLNLTIPTDSNAHFCMSVEVLNVPEFLRMYSSMGSEPMMGSMLGFEPAWMPHANYSDEEAWLQMDLDHVMTLAGVVVQGSGDDSTWAKQFQVNSSSDGEHWVDLGSHTGGDSADAIVQVWLPRLVEAKYVRVIATDVEKTSAMRAAVLACEVPWVLRQGKRVRQSSTADDSFAERAWDGDFTSSFDANESSTCAETESMTNPWWEVDMRDIHFIRGVMIVSAPSPYGERLGPLSVYVDGMLCASDVDFVNETSMLPTVLCDSPHIVERAVADSRMEPGIFGKVVRIELTDRTEALILCEVAVLAERLEFSKAPVNLTIPEHSTSASYCTSVSVLNPPERHRGYSSLREISLPSPTQSTLNSRYAWTAQNSSLGGWVEIDLGDIITLAGVVMQGSTIEHAWVSSFQVNYSTDGHQWSELGPLQGVESAGATVQIWFPRLIEAEYMRVIALDYMNQISMRVAVISCSVPWVLRVGKPVRQSTVFNNLGADRAWDGNFNPKIASDTCVQTGQGASPFWEVDLLSKHFVRGILLSNPEPPYDLAQFNVLVDGVACASNVEVANGTTVTVLCDSAYATDRVSYDGRMVDTGVFGSVVRVELTDRIDVLTLCEVAVLAERIFTLPSPTALLVEEEETVRRDPPPVCDAELTPWRPPCYNVSLDAGVMHHVMELLTTNHTPPVPYWSDEVLFPFGLRLKLAPPSLTRYDAWIGSCEYVPTEGVMVVGGSKTMNASFNINNTREAATARLPEHLLFPMGGAYSLCLSSDGSFTFGTADIADMDITVNGVYDHTPSCYPDCLAAIHYDCYIRIDEHNLPPGADIGSRTSCVIDFAYDGGGFVGNVGNISWSAEFAEPTYSFQGVRTGPVVEQPCGTSPATFLCTDGDTCENGDRIMDMDADNDHKRSFLPPTTRGLDRTVAKAKAVAACYCPDRNSCQNHEDFVQRVGVIYFYLTRICRPNDLVCVQAYPGVLSRFRFTVRVECPPGACRPDDQSRVRLVRQAHANDLPSWDRNTGCRRAEELHISPINCYEPLNCTLSGGVREDWKRFGSSEGIEIRLGRSPYELRNGDLPLDVDVCYCNERCHHGSQWFKVGIFRYGPLRLVSGQSSTATLQEDWAVEYVHQAGVLGIHVPRDNAGALGTREGGVLKIVEDEAKAVRNDSACAAAPWDTPPGLLASGPSTSALARSNYLGYLTQTQAGPDQEYYIFNSGNPPDPITNEAVHNRIQVSKVTTLAVCYCIFTLPDNSCESASAWKLISHILIRGPYSGWRWEVSTEVEFDLSYTGLGLATDHSLRIINFGGSCTADNGNPNEGRFERTGLRVKCPGACADVGTVNDTEKGDIRSVLHSGHMLNLSIIHIRVVSRDATEVHFAEPHGLVMGDMLTLDEDFEVECDPDSPCNFATLEVLRGIFRYGDAQNNYQAVGTLMGQAPDTYMVGNRVLRVVDPYLIHLDIGWPEPSPIFLLGENTTGWVRRNAASTSREILGRTEQYDLRVCWGYATPYTARVVYVTEIGRINILEPPAMVEKPRIFMTSTAIGRSSPMILSFHTSGGQVGLRYGAARESLRLRLVFFNTDILDIQGGDGEELPDDDPDEEGPPEDASQARCGELLLELWSSDSSCGFPMPKGCYVRSYGYMQRREVYILFEKQSALRNATSYQLVFNAQVRSTEAKLEGRYMFVDVLDELHTERRYKVIERGEVLLMASPEPPARDPNNGGDLDAQFAPGGFRIIGEDDSERSLMQLERSTSELVVEVQGPATESGKIKRESILTFYLWPLTQWDTAETCTTECINTDHACGYILTLCRVLSLDGVRNNALRLQLPENFQDLYGNDTIQLRLGGLKMPVGGFFAGRMGGQVTRRDGRNPSYAVSGGAFIWKAPDSGLSFGRLVGEPGNGNDRPFSSDRGNTLYVKVLLPSTILAGMSMPDVSFTVTLPAGYTCAMPDARANGSNPWEVEESLPILAGQAPPQCRGTPLAKHSPTFGWSVRGNRCIFTPDHPYGVVYAGSSLYLRITAHNPPQPLPWTDASNTWTLQMTGRGHWTSQQSTQEYPLINPDGSYSNVGVLGRLTGISCQPTDFRPLVWQELFCFFTPVQPVEALGRLEIMSPMGFDFGWEDLGEDAFGRDLGLACRVRDLLDSYYAMNNDPTTATLRLPGIRACDVHSGHPSNASIVLDQALQAGRVYGFGLFVRNAHAFHPRQLTDWKLFTIDGSGHRVDGTRESIPFLPSSGDFRSWALYPPNDFSASISISDPRPFELTGERAMVTVVLSNLEVRGPLLGGMRLVAPDGYKWTFEREEFLYRAPRDARRRRQPSPEHLPRNAHRLPEDVGATADFPLGLPEWDGGPALIFRHRVYSTTTNMPAEDNDTDADDDAGDIDDDNMNATMTRMLLEEAARRMDSDRMMMMENDTSEDNISGEDWMRENYTDDNRMDDDFDNVFENETYGDFSPYEVYAFVAYLTIPSAKPTTSIDAIFLEIGYGSEEPYGRIGVDVHQMEPLSALSMAMVHYTSNVEGMTNMVQIRIRTATTIPPGGGLIITAPASFMIEDPCDLMLPDPAFRAAGNHDTYMLWISECRAAVRMGDRPSLRLYAGSAPIPPNTYAFALQVRNPWDALVNAVDTTTPCGMQHCWDFESVLELEDITNETEYVMVPPLMLPPEPAGPNAHLDLATSVSSFDINLAMLSAYIPWLSLDLRILTLRNDRRAVANNVVFAFSLRQSATSGSSLLFHGPEGIEFSVDCLPGLEVHRDRVLGSWDNFDADFYTQWPGLVKVRTCSGNRATAHLGLVFVGGAVLAGEATYLIRMPIRSNPMVAPARNAWTMELRRNGYPGETSGPFEGFRLSTFAEAGVFPSTSAAGPLLSSVARPRNPVQVQFRVFNPVPPGGHLIVTMPQAYEVDAVFGDCLANLEEIVRDDDISYSWRGDAGMFSCQVDSSNPQRVTFVLSDGAPRGMLAGDVYRIVFVVFNPPLEEAGVDIDWHLESRLPSGYPLDEGDVMGFYLNPEMLTWEVTPSSEMAPILTHGATLIRDLAFSMSFPGDVLEGDEIHIVAPPAFELEDDFVEGMCRAFGWITPESMFSSDVMCNSSSMVIRAVGDAYLLQGEVATFTLTIQNPPLRIPAISNVWVCTHFSSAMMPQSSRVFDSWPIDPQLTDVSLQLLGPRFASGALSTLEVTFRPVADAGFALIALPRPSGFDFSSASLRQGARHLTMATIVATFGHRLWLELGLRAGHQVHLEIDNVVLGSHGGRTSMSISTWHGSAWEGGVWNPGERQDEKLDFTGGFRLPSRISFTGEHIRTERHENPTLFPVQSMWKTHMGIPAFAEFDVHVAGETDEGDVLAISGEPFNFTPQRLHISVSVEDAREQNLTDIAEDCVFIGHQHRCILPIENVSAGGSFLEFSLGFPMVPDVFYHLTASVLTPPAPVTTSLRELPSWLMLIVDDERLPEATNDGISTSFQLAEAYRFQVAPVQRRAPPGSLIEVDVHLEPGLVPPTEIHILAPHPFTFPELCLVEGSNLVMSCVRASGLVAGREVASLRTIRSGLSVQPPSLRILVQTPSGPWEPQGMDEASAWLVQGLNFSSREQLGWGLTRSFPVHAMSGVTVTYPGTGTVQGLMVWSFSLSLNAMNGSRLELTLPLGVDASCNPGQFTPMVLPGVTSCEKPSEQVVAIPIKQMLPMGNYVMAFPVVPPSRTPFRNVLSIEVKDERGYVQEALHGVAGSTIETLPMQALSLGWTMSDPGNESLVTLGFRILGLLTLEQQAAQGIRGVQEILITFPEGYISNISGSADIIVPSGMPLISDSWYDDSWAGYLRLRLDANLAIGFGLHEIRFPVIVPEATPRYNVWQMTICGRTGSCDDIADSGVLVNMPVLGFDIGEQAPPRQGLDPPSTTSTTLPGTEPVQRAANITGSFNMQVTLPAELTLCSTEFFALLRTSFAATLAAITEDTSYVPEEVKDLTLDGCSRLRRLQSSPGGSVVASYMVTSTDSSSADTLVNALEQQTDTFSDVLQYDLWQRGSVMAWNMVVDTPTVALPSTTSTTTTPADQSTSQQPSSSSSSTTPVASSASTSPPETTTPSAASTTPQATTLPSQTTVSAAPTQPPTTVNPYDNVDLLHLFLGRSPVADNGDSGSGPIVFPQTSGSLCTKISPHLVALFWTAVVKLLLFC